MIYWRGSSELRELAINIVFVAFCSIYVIGSLWIADTLLSKHLPGYVFSGDYKYGILIFIIASLVFLYWSRWREWKNWRYFIFGPIAFFFPLVFVSSSLTLLFNPSGSIIVSFTNTYCGTSEILDVCGKAFAAVVSSMSLRALPAVLSTPLLLLLVLDVKQRYYPER